MASIIKEATSTLLPFLYCLYLIVFLVKTAILMSSPITAKIVYQVNLITLLLQQRADYILVHWNSISCMGMFTFLKQTSNSEYHNLEIPASQQTFLISFA